MQEKKGIWKYKHKLPRISPEFQLTLGEGKTKLVEVEGISFKCEFENPSGSVKDRGIAYQLAKILERGFKSAVISSSGNAAISAAFYCQKAGITLYVYVSPNINPAKLYELEKYPCRITKTIKPISSAWGLAKTDPAIFNLRQSKDPNAVYGYQTIAFELLEQKPETDAVFIPVSSGTAFAGIYQGFKKLGRLPALHIVQTEAIHPIAAIYDKDFEEKKKSLADAIVARFTDRETMIKDGIVQSRGNGWVISDKEMVQAKEWLKRNDLICSYEGAAALAALWKARTKGYQYSYPVCLLTGKDYSI